MNRDGAPSDPDRMRSTDFPLRLLAATGLLGSVLLVGLAASAAGDLWSSGYERAGYFAFFCFFSGGLGLSGLAVWGRVALGREPGRWRRLATDHARPAFWCCLLMTLVAESSSWWEGNDSALPVVYFALAWWFTLLRLAARLRGCSKAA